MAPALVGGLLLLPWVVHVTLNAHAVPPVLGGAGYGSYAAFYGQGLAADPVTMLVTVPGERADDRAGARPGAARLALGAEAGRLLLAA